jgi:pyridoxamine 5'-phosphate oxidase
MNTLIPDDFTEAADPFALFEAWFSEAKASDPEDPNAMALATVDAVGVPNVRMVLLKDANPRGFVFYTNLESEKGREIAGASAAAGVLHWKSLRRQVRFRGPVERVTAAEADTYFASRARVSRLGAWASKQSRPLASRAVLEGAVAEIDARYPGDAIPRPSHWSGFRILAREIEFWHDRSYRLHDRVRFTRAGEAGEWTRVRLWP